MTNHKIKTAALRIKTMMITAGPEFPLTVSSANMDKHARDAILRVLEQLGNPVRKSGTEYLVTFRNSRQLDKAYDVLRRRDEQADDKIRANMEADAKRLAQREGLSVDEWIDEHADTYFEGEHLTDALYTAINKASKAKAASSEGNIVTSAGISKKMESHLKGLLEEQENRRMMPRVTAEALQRRGLLQIGTAVSPLHALQTGLVRVSLTEAGFDLAVDILKREHADRLAQGLKSERIPRILAKNGVHV